MELKLKDRKKTLSGKISFRCFEEQEREMKALGNNFDFNEWLRDSLAEGLKRAKSKKKAS